MTKVISQFAVPDEGTILQLDGPTPMAPYSKYRIDGVDYEPVLVYDLPLCIGIRESGDFVGKTIEFI